MIAYLRGKVEVRENYVVILTSSGVGYKVLVGEKILQRGNQEQAEVHTYAYIREDRFELYGFESQSELALFELLIGVSGCGPKTALAIAEAGSKEITQAIQQANVSFFAGFPRVGKKLAQKLIIELKNKLGGLKDLDLTPKSQVYQDVFEALQTLGFAEGQINEALAGMDLEKVSAGEAVKAALRKLRGVSPP